MKEKVSVSISKNVHSSVKRYCDRKALKIGSWIENVLGEKLNDLIDKGEYK